MLEDCFGGIIERNQRMTPKIFGLSNLNKEEDGVLRKAKWQPRTFCLGVELILDPLNIEAQMSIKKLVYQVCIWGKNLGWMYDFGVSRRIGCEAWNLDELTKGVNTYREKEQELIPGMVQKWGWEMRSDQPKRESSSQSHWKKTRMWYSRNQVKTGFQEERSDHLCQMLLINQKRWRLRSGHWF